MNLHRLVLADLLDELADSIQDATMGRIDKTVATRFPLPSAAHLKLLTFRLTAALQRCKLSLSLRLVAAATMRGPPVACNCGGAFPAYGPVTELSGFLSLLLEVQSRDDTVHTVQPG